MMNRIDLEGGIRISESLIADAKLARAGNVEVPPVVIERTGERSHPAEISEAGESCCQPIGNAPAPDAVAGNVSDVMRALVIFGDAPIGPRLGVMVRDTHCAEIRDLA